MPLVYNGGCVGDVVSPGFTGVSHKFRVIKFRDLKSGLLLLMAPKNVSERRGAFIGINKASVWLVAYVFVPGEALYQVWQPTGPPAFTVVLQFRQQRALFVCQENQSVVSELLISLCLM
ncbi:hypothetical protein EYF80_025563 [Liparis tanakae]|uniref:Uncharacterized protein n=1 Tax=Liparis tanakae TaxID=230148 RepID=A0A4Z2HG39_9TELE|nr:hypothetical protein EYF80_025563 [Liparis tanakae]